MQDHLCKSCDKHLGKKSVVLFAFWKPADNRAQQKAQNESCRDKQLLVPAELFWLQKKMTSLRPQMQPAAAPRLLPLPPGGGSRSASLRANAASNARSFARSFAYNQRQSKQNLGQLPLPRLPLAGLAMLGSKMVFRARASKRPGPSRRCQTQTISKEIDEKFQQTRLVTFTGMVLGYATYYFTRLSFTYVGLAMRSDLGLSMVQLGTISSLFPLAYMNSKFLSGILSDLLGSPVLIFSLGLMCTGLLNIAFSAASTVPIFTLIWLLNGLFQGCGATPCNKMLVNWFPARSRGKWWSSWNASHNMGGFLIPLLAGGLAARFSWRAGMLGPGIIALIAGALALIFMKDSPEKQGLPTAEAWGASRETANSKEEKGEKEEKETDDAAEDEKLWKQLLKNKFLWCMAAMHFFIYFIRQGVLNWAHFYIMDEFGVPALEATARVSGFELGGLLGCIVAGQVSDRLISRYPQRGAAGLRARVAWLK